MASTGQIRGAVLEEVLLYLLQLAGYRIVEYSPKDPTLYQGPAGLEVLGRGGRHQIGAVADFAVGHPFSHPARLLVEAKFNPNLPFLIVGVRETGAGLCTKDICQITGVFQPPETFCVYAVSLRKVPLRVNSIRLTEP